MQSVSAIVKALVARVLGRNTNIRGLDRWDRGIFRERGVACNHCGQDYSLSWELTTAVQTYVYCSEQCIVFNLNQKEDSNTNLIASNFRSEFMDSCTARVSISYFRDEIGWINTERYSAFDPRWN